MRSKAAPALTSASGSGGGLIALPRTTRTTAPHAGAGFFGNGLRARRGFPLRRDYDAARVRLTARESNDAKQVRRLLALAAVYDGATRAEAAEVAG